MDKLAGKKIIVLGGSSGIGYGTAELLLEAGAHVTIISSSADKVASAVERLNSPHAQGKVGDVRDEAALTALLVSLAPVDHVVVSVVETLVTGDLPSMDLAAAKAKYDTKFWGSVVVAKAVAGRDVIRAGGSLTLTAGKAAINPGRHMSVHGALNGGLLTLTKGLATDLREKKIRVNVVIPGLVATALWDKVGLSKEAQEKKWEEAGKELSVGFVAKGRDIAEAYLYLIRADYANGSEVIIDGGADI